MQINNSSIQNPIQPFGQAPKLPNRADVGRDNQQQVEQQQRNDRIDVDQGAISLLEQEKQASQNRTSQNNTSYDQPSQRNATAVNAYQSVDNLEQRESVQQLLGVDLFA